MRILLAVKISFVDPAVGKALKVELRWGLCHVKYTLVDFKWRFMRGVVHQTLCKLDNKIRVSSANKSVLPQYSDTSEIYVSLKGLIMYPSSPEVWINAVQYFVTYLWSSDFLVISVSSKQDPLTPEKEFFCSPN
jgi:hypothetical protein